MVVHHSGTFSAPILLSAKSPVTASPRALEDPIREVCVRPHFKKSDRATLLDHRFTRLGTPARRPDSRPELLASNRMASSNHLRLRLVSPFHNTAAASPIVLSGSFDLCHYPFRPQQPDFWPDESFSSLLVFLRQQNLWRAILSRFPVALTEKRHRRVLSKPVV